jgi:hypothetical protein
MRSSIRNVAVSRAVRGMAAISVGEREKIRRFGGDVWKLGRRSDRKWYAI